MSGAQCLILLLFLLLLKVPLVQLPKRSHVVNNPSIVGVFCSFMTAKMEKKKIRGEQNKINKLNNDICREFAWWFDYPQTSSTGWRMESVPRAKSLLGWPNQSGCSYLAQKLSQSCRRQLLGCRGDFGSLQMELLQHQTPAGSAASLSFRGEPSTHRHAPSMGWFIIRASFI